MPRLLPSLLFLVLSGSSLQAAIPPRVHALLDAEVVVDADAQPRRLDIVLRDGLVEAVGPELEPPADARVWRLAGRHVYPGLIDVHVSSGQLNDPDFVKHQRKQQREAKGSRGSSTPIESELREPWGLHSERRASQLLEPAPKALERLRKAGFTLAAAVPEGGLLAGSLSLLHLGEGPLEQRLLAEDLAQSVELRNRGWRSGGYPNSLMGAIAAVRQALLDAQWQRRAHELWREAPRPGPRPPIDQRLVRLEPVARGELPLVISGAGALLPHRARALVQEFGLEAWLLASGHEHERLDLLRQAGLPLVLPVDWPEPPRVWNQDAWVQLPLRELRHWRRAPSLPAWVESAGLRFALTSHGLEKPEQFPQRVRQALERGLSRKAALAAVTREPARLLGLESRLGSIEPGKLAYLTVLDGELFAPEARVESLWIDGEPLELLPPDPDPDPETEAQIERQKKQDDRSERALAAPELDPEAPPPDTRGPDLEPESVLVRGATVWTQGPDGVLQDADMLVREGRIVAIGEGLEPPAGAHLIDASGLHLTPGLIDAHSHIAIEGAVNEGTLAVTAHVRIADVLDSEDVSIYRALAGGLTTANLVHGSANPIGGQAEVIKLRWGAGPDRLRFDAARPGIKFALGENVKQSNWGESYTTRFPQTRMGVEQVFRESFAAALDYRRRQREALESGGVPPRPDLRWEALLEVLDGKRAVHCHSYRQDEILMMIRVAEDFGFKIGVFQHVLEGYKVADEIAAHGAGASCFSDWWAYKFEVYDAIPYAGALMHERGVVVSFNSDSAELMRRMNLEAAKAVAYGGVEEQDALDFVTANPARQLGVSGRVGSLEPGKDADFVLWSGHPLAADSLALETWIEGRRYFDRERDLAARAGLEREHQALLEAARAARKKLPAAEQEPALSRDPDAPVVDRHRELGCAGVELALGEVLR